MTSATRPEDGDAETRYNVDTGRAAVVFTVAELWLLNSFVRHEMQDQERWLYPPASRDLNQEIALAIAACGDCGLKEFALSLSRGDLLVLDYNIRQDMKTPEGASGHAILTKVFEAMRDVAYGSPAAGKEKDRTYREAKEAKDASADKDPDQDPDQEPGH